MSAIRATLTVGLCCAAVLAVAMVGCSPPAGNGNNNNNSNTNSNSNANSNNNDNGSIPDPNEQVCERIDRCCAGDGFCDTEQCDAADLDCADCPANDECVIGCAPIDPDCENEEVCERSEFCCAGDETCDIAECPDPDPDCTGCAADGACVIGCSPIDADCSNQDVCEATEFCCASDEICDSDGCPTADTDCASCGADGACVALCPTVDPDCTANEDICDRAGFCCADDPFCDVDQCPETDPDC